MMPASPLSPSIVCANEPRSYRQALTRAFQAQRPGLQVVAVDPDELDEAVQQHAPLLVICDRLTQVVETGVAAWVLLYPGGAREVTSSLSGVRESAADLDLDELLAFVDRAGTPLVTP
jgi:hypothetical protein